MEKEFKDLWIVTHLSFLFFMLSFLNSLLRSVRNYFWIFIFSKIVPNPTKKELESEKLENKKKVKIEVKKEEDFEKVC